MPISNRTPPKDLSKGLAVSETTLRKADEALKNAQAMGLKPDEVQVLETARDTLLDARVRTEFPVLSRVLEDIKGKLEAGESLSFTPAQTQGLLDIMQDLSFAENAMLNKLRDLDVIPKEQFDAFVQPHKDSTNELHGSTGRKAKWGLASFANMGASSAIGYGVAIAAGGPVGAVGALAASTIWGMTVGQKIGGKISENAFIEGALLGMNQAQGKEVVSEVMLLASRAVSGDILVDNNGSLKDRLQREIAVGDMLVGARQKSGEQFAELELPFVDISAKWLEGLPKIAEGLEKGTLSEVEARAAIMALRGQVLDEKGLESVAQTALSTYVKDADGQQLLLVRQLSSFADNLVKHLQENGGKPDATMQQTAAAMVMIYQMAGEKVGALDERGMKLLGLAAAGEKLTDAQVKELDTQVAAKAKATLAKKEPELEVTSSDALKQARLAFDVLWKTVVPSFQDAGDAPVAKRMKAEKLDDGSYQVSGTFKGGFLGLGNEGEFSVKVDAVGQVSAESIHIDLGADFMKDAAKTALAGYAELAGIYDKPTLHLLSNSIESSSASPRDVKVTKQGKAPDDNYELTARLGDKNVKLEITPMGMVAWDKLELS